MLDPLSLRYFAVVASAGTVSSAARRLHASQPSVSRRIHQLESELDASLFERTPKGMTLTAAGRAVLAYTDEMLRLTDQVRHTAQNVLGTDTNVVRIGLYPAAAPVFVSVLHRLRRIAPWLDVQPTVDKPAALLDALRKNAIDIALPGYAKPELLSEFAGIKVTSVRLLYVLWEGHPLAERKRLRLGDLHGEKFIVLHELDFPGCHALVVELCRQAGFRASIAAEARDMADAVALVAARRGITLLPPSALVGPLVRAVRLLPCETRVDWFAFWNDTNGNPNLATVIRTLRRAKPAHWPGKQLVAD
ncbi:LysR family transcriptional regulator [Horticoccus sp. 23ND18S-11]|uniref:LysR family transcriptional regulator n=1 Tax=Horticoccus sp. 23ND18S-11 TaxID=3391832 RepID=UPI0039C97C29